MLRIVMLGSGGAIPSPKRNVSCVGIRYSGKVYALDACEGMQKQMMKYKLSYFKIRAVFVSHLHPDHYLGIPGLVYTLQLSGFNDELRIVGPKGIGGIVEGLLCGKVPNFINIDEFSDEGEVYKEDGFAVKAFKVAHGDNSYGFAFEEEERRKFDEKMAKRLGIKGRMFKEIESKGFVEVNGKRIELDEVSWIKKGRKIVYSGDTRLCSSVVENAKNADLLIHDATFLDIDRKDADEKMHSTALDAAKTAKKANCKLLVLTHISNKYRGCEGHIKEAGEIFENAVCAEDGIEIHI